MEERYWKQFENSGRIEDYLSFVSSNRQETDMAGIAGEGGHAGIYIGDGHHFEADPGGGVRQAYQPAD
ncbi:C40 family peptidase [Acetatifactor muris]|jgi:uncharacterized protein YycO|uniref:hypothetical protein n=1 Tax=Acetatifactor muris TaxID=879566 RepID=UPI0011AF787B|nr:hypothetical protein [Acetatifactor muris]MCI8799675.1 hypothetical protein [Lachnospiraceae bacterium]MCR2049705.1 C40 family peptidase [Acetatifactor muris]